MNMLVPHVPKFTSRREFLFKAGSGFGARALAYLLERDGLLPGAETDSNSRLANPLAPRQPHQAARTKAVIFLFMEGGPSHIDTFDPKPELSRRQGQRLPASFGTVFTPMGTGGKLLIASRRA